MEVRRNGTTLGALAAFRLSKCLRKRKCWKQWAVLMMWPKLNDFYLGSFIQLSANNRSKQWLSWIVWRKTKLPDGPLFISSWKTGLISTNSKFFLFFQSHRLRRMTGKIVMLFDSISFRNPTRMRNLLLELTRDCSSVEDQDKVHLLHYVIFWLYL